MRADYFSRPTAARFLLTPVTRPLHVPLPSQTSVMQKQLSSEKKLDALGVLYYNSMIAAPLALMLSLVTGEARAVLDFPSLHDPRFQGGFLVSSVMGLVLTYTSVLCTTYTSPLAASMTGNIKDLLTTAFGMLVFHDFIPTALSMGGLGLSFLGAFLFGYVALRKTLANSTPAAAPPSSDGAAAPSLVVSDVHRPGAVRRVARGAEDAEGLEETTALMPAQRSVTPNTRAPTPRNA